MGTHPIFESDFDCLTDFAQSGRLSKMGSHVAPYMPANYQCAQPTIPSTQPTLPSNPSGELDDYYEEIFKRTLYVGNLHKSTSEFVLRELFKVIGNVTDVKMITHEGQPDQAPYCFVTYDSHEHAMTALSAMNGREIHKMPLKVNWATRPDGIRKDTSRDFHIFVGDLSQEITTNELKKHFEVFGDISEARVVRDSQTNRSKGYGFIAFVNKAAAARAIEEMNHKRIGGREVRTNWATSKRAPPQAPCDPEAVARAASEYNTTVYVGGIRETDDKGYNDKLLRDNFTQFGSIEEIRLFDNKGYGFIKFQTHVAATSAICEMHGKSVPSSYGNVQLKCRWGKDDHKNDNYAGSSGSSGLKEVQTGQPLLQSPVGVPMWNPNHPSSHIRPNMSTYVQPTPYQGAIPSIPYHQASPYMGNACVVPAAWGGAGNSGQSVPYYYPATTTMAAMPTQSWPNVAEPKKEN